MKQFQTAARRGTAGVINSVPITFEYEVNPGEFVEMVATPPTSGQLALFLADQTGGGETVRALFKFLDTVLRDDDYTIIERQLRDGLDVDVIVEMIQYLTEEWGARPTKRSSASSGSPSRNGPKSTVKRRAAASTTSR